MKCARGTHNRQAKNNTHLYTDYEVMSILEETRFSPNRLNGIVIWRIYLGCGSFCAFIYDFAIPNGLQFFSSKNWKTNTEISPFAITIRMIILRVQLWLNIMPYQNEMVQYDDIYRYSLSTQNGQQKVLFNCTRAARKMCLLLTRIEIIIVQTEWMWFGIVWVIAR